MASSILGTLTIVSYLFFHWKGVLTDSSITFKIFVNPRLANQVSQWHLVYYQEGNDVIKSENLPISISLEPIQLTLTNLSPLTLYKYCFFFGDINSFSLTTKGNQTEIYQFKTFQIPYLKQSLLIPFSSCAKTGSEDQVFIDIVEMFKDAEFFLQMGDIFYGDIISEDSAVLYQESYFRIFESKTQSVFYQHFPVIYMWDDHDFGENNSGRTSKSKDSATEMFMQNALYYPLRTYPHKINTVKSSGIYQHVIIGQTLLIIMDLRTGFEQYVTAMDEEQFNWVIEMLDWADKETRIDNVLIVSSFPWQGDDWISFKQRKPIGDKIGQLLKTKQNILMITGDAHMIAFDNGYNNDAGGFASIVSSPMDKTPSCKGGKYTFGPFEGNGQYSTLQIVYHPENSTNCFLIKGWRKKDMLFFYDSCNPLHKNLKTSNSCFVDMAVAIIISISLIIAIGVLVLLIWYLGYRATTSIKQKEKQYVEIPQYHKQVEIRQFFDSPAIQNKVPLPKPSKFVNTQVEQNLNTLPLSKVFSGLDNISGLKSEDRTFLQNDSDGKETVKID